MEQKKIANRQQESQKEHIAILGIFAAVVLAFTGGIAFSTSVLQNMHTSSVYRIVLIVSLIGIVLFNSLYGLFYYIDCILHDDRSDKKKTEKPLIIGNAILIIIIMVITFFAWELGITEKRDIKIEKNISEGARIETSVDTQTDFNENLMNG